MCLVLVYFLKLVILGFLSGRIAGRISEICGKKWTKSLKALYIKILLCLRVKFAVYQHLLG